MGNKLGKLVSPDSPDALTPGVPVSLFESDPVTLSSADILAGTAVEIVPAQAGKVLVPVGLVAHTHPGESGYEGQTTQVFGTVGGLTPAPEFEFALGTTDEWTTLDGQPIGSSLPPEAGAQSPATLEGPITVAVAGATGGDGSATFVLIYYAINIP